MTTKTPKVQTANIRTDFDKIIIRTKNAVKNRFLRVPESPVTPTVLRGDISGGETPEDAEPYRGARNVRSRYTENNEELSSTTHQQTQHDRDEEKFNMESEQRRTVREPPRLRVPSTTSAASLNTGDNGSNSGQKARVNSTFPSLTANLRSKVPRYQTSSDSFSQEFVYAATVLAVLVILGLAWRMSKAVYATLHRPAEEKLEVAVTRDMRYSKYEIVSPDTYNGDAVRKDGTRRRNRSASTAAGRASSATNTFLLFSPNTVE